MGILFEVRDMFRKQTDLHEPAKLLMALARTNGYKVLRTFVDTHPLDPWHVQVTLENVRMSQLTVGLDEDGMVSVVMGKSILMEAGQTAWLYDAEDAEEPLFFDDFRRVDEFLVKYLKWC